MLAALSVPIGGSLCLFAWGRWVARRHPQSAGFRHAAKAPLVALGVLVLGILWGIAAMARVSADARSATVASDKARVFAEGISAAVNAYALFAAVAGMLWLASVVAFAWGSFRRGS